MLAASWKFLDEPPGLRADPGSFDYAETIRECESSHFAQDDRMGELVLQLHPLREYLLATKPLDKTKILVIPSEARDLGS